MTITFATYNILHGYHRDKIINNINFLLDKKIDVLCIQEAELPLEDFLPSVWHVEYFFTPERGCRLAVAWNTTKLHLVDTEKILLPGISKPDLMQKMTGYSREKIQRGALVAKFTIEGKTVRITNAHLAWEGGTKNRLQQLRFLLRQPKETATYEILAGDFNTAVPSVFRRTQESKIEKVLGPLWTNVFPNLAWTCDLSYTDPQDGFETAAKICKILKIKARTRLDYIFVENLVTESKQMFDLPGSDHRPLLATFEI